MVVGGRELIDTLWNVNRVLSGIPFLDPGINRYIMECKYTIYIINKICCSELIDTLWNVNFRSTGVFCMYTRINRYIMECKYAYPCFLAPYAVEELIDTLWNVNVLVRTSVLYGIF